MKAKVSFLSFANAAAALATSAAQFLGLLYEPATA
jgi:hypothetical protein